MGARFPLRKWFAQRMAQSEGDYPVGHELPPLHDEFGFVRAHELFPLSLIHISTGSCAVCSRPQWQVPCRTSVPGSQSMR